ncbi:MAG TPA: RtcB family protein [Vicinamibacterales bacterium]|nr:RtcB family protein [Vicinamibacterales bacterium]
MAETAPSSNVVVFGEHEPNTLAQLNDVASRAERAALMADGHQGYVMPIGGVAAYTDKVSVVGVGFDIACGNAAIRTNLMLHGTPGLVDRLPALADEIQDVLSFGVGRKNRADDAPVDHDLFRSDAWTAVPGHAREALRSKARAQLGTVGSGNHYVDVFVDETDTIWVGVHFGSRGFGHTVASGFLALSQNAKWGQRVPEREALLGLDTPIGQDYWALMSLAGDYAYAGREWVARKVVSLLDAGEVELVHNHHNFAWREEHDGREVVVVRKGATPAFPGQKGFVGGSMGDEAVIVQGAFAAGGPLEALQRKALFSTVHGAGRVMSRTQAAGKRDRRTGKMLSPGLVSPEMMHGWVREKGVILRGGGLDESPHAYRRLPSVLEAQRGTIEVLHTLRPLIVVMAGADLFDPYKD